MGDISLFRVAEHISGFLVFMRYILMVYLLFVLLPNVAWFPGRSVGNYNDECRYVAIHIWSSRHQDDSASKSRSPHSSAKYFVIDHCIVFHHVCFFVS